MYSCAPYKKLKDDDAYINTTQQGLHNGLPIEKSLLDDGPCGYHLILDTSLALLV
jgi:hypothetical protein